MPDEPAGAGFGEGEFHPFFAQQGANLFFK
jgi:hypothetical protein